MANHRVGLCTEARLSPGEGGEHGHVDDGDEDARSGGGQVAPSDGLVVDQRHRDEDRDDDGLGDEPTGKTLVKLPWRGSLEVELHGADIGREQGFLDPLGPCAAIAEEKSRSATAASDYPMPLSVRDRSGSAGGSRVEEPAGGLARRPSVTLRVHPHAQRSTVHEFPSSPVAVPRNRLLESIVAGQAMFGCPSPSARAGGESEERRSAGCRSVAPVTVPEVIGWTSPSPVWCAGCAGRCAVSPGQSPARRCAPRRNSAEATLGAWGFDSSPADGPTREGSAEGPPGKLRRDCK